MADVTTANPVELARQYQQKWRSQNVLWMGVLLAGVVLTAISATYVAKAFWADSEFPATWIVIGVTAVFLTLLSAARRRVLARARAIRTVERAVAPFLVTGATVDGAAISRAIVEGLNQLDRY